MRLQAIVVLAVVVIILISLASGILVRGNFWLYPILISTVLGVSVTQVGVMSGGKRAPWWRRGCRA
jgi:hypothetical protein